MSTCKRSLIADAPDFFESSFWKDSHPKSGLGGWGDPNKDYSVPDGGFRKLRLSYPSPHIVRRNFTLRAFDIPFVVFKNTDPTLEANKTFLAHAVEKILKVSDYRRRSRGWGENSAHSQVASNRNTSGATRRCPLNSWRVSCCFFDLTFAYTQHNILFSNLTGNCPENAPSCVPGPKWSPNGRSKA